MNDLYIHQLETENKQLRQQLIYVNEVVQEYLYIEKHCDELENKIDKAIEYMEEAIHSDSYTTLPSGKETDIAYCIVAFKDLLEILGDKERK